MAPYSATPTAPTLTGSPERTPYVGRFAPSPTGPLHFGSLIAALGSYLEARHHGGQWLLRIEDVDAPRTVPGATDTILRQLDAYGLNRDGDILYQSQRTDIYREALNRLIADGKAFACACTRRELADSALAPDGSRRYPGTCRSGLPPGQSARAWRLRTTEGVVAWHDAIQGDQAENVAQAVGDFVLLRADGQFAYQLAVVVDDACQGVTHVVRGADLLGSTARQIALHAALALPPPHYAHLPVAANPAGEKLSKQTLARAIDPASPVQTLHDALVFLGQAPPRALRDADLQTLWAWSLANWSLARVPAVISRPVPTDVLHNALGSPPPTAP